MFEKNRQTAVSWLRRFESDIPTALTLPVETIYSNSTQFWALNSNKSTTKSENCVSDHLHSSNNHEKACVNIEKIFPILTQYPEGKLNKRSYYQKLLYTGLMVCFKDSKYIFFKILETRA